MCRISSDYRAQRAATEPCRRKLSLCGAFPITSAVAFRLIDHRPAATAVLSYEVYSGNGDLLNGTAVLANNDTAAMLAAGTVSASTKGDFNVNVSTVHMVLFLLVDLGVHILAIYLDGKQASAKSRQCCSSSPSNTYIT